MLGGCLARVAAASSTPSSPLPHLLPRRPDKPKPPPDKFYYYFSAHKNGQLEKGRLSPVFSS